MRRLALVGTAFVTLGLAVAGFATWRIWERQIPGGRPTVAVADFANETGDSELDGISGLLITSLEQGTQLRVLTRGRMVDVLKQLGKGAVERIDEALAREVGKETRANALLLASIRKLGDAYVVEMRALDPLHDEYIFTVSDRAAGKGAIFDLVDRLGAATRRRLGTPDTKATPPPRVASITTDNPKAWALLSQSRQATDRLDIPESRRLAQEAVKEDPEFALAYHQLAIAAFWHESRRGFQEVAPGVREMEAAEARAHRLPEKERLTLRIFRALIDGRVADAVRLSAEAAAAYPLDKDVLIQVGDVLFHNLVGLHDAVDYFERALHLDPANAFAIDHLLATAWMTGQSARVIPLVERLAGAARREEDAPLRGTPAGRRRAEELEVLSRPLLAVGREAEAVELIDRSLVLLDRPVQPQRGNVWNSYLCHHGRCAEAEAGIRDAVARFLAAEGDPRLAGKKPPYYQLAAVLIASGRVREGVATMDAHYPDGISGPAARVDAGVAIGSPEAIEAAYSQVPDAKRAPPWADDRERWLLYAVAGDVARAREAVLRVRTTPEWQSALTERERREGAAIVAWSEGRHAEAERLFQEGGDQGGLFERFRGLLGSGAMHYALGNCPAAIVFLERARAVPWPSELWQSFLQLPVLLHRLATCYEKTGDLGKARERNAEMLSRWEKADDDIPLLVEAKAMRERLAAAPGGAGSAR